MLTGVYRTLEKVDESIESAEKLHYLKYYIPATALSTISYEESIKGIILCMKILKKEDVSHNEWNDITDHKYKLKTFHQKSLENVESKISDEKFDQILKLYIKWGLKPRALNRKQFANAIKTDIEILPKYKILRERCLYSDWNKATKEWFNLKAFSDKQLELLSTYLLATAANEQRNFCFDIEYTVNMLRKYGMKLENLPYPTYNEERKSENYESIKEIKDVQTKIIQKGKDLTKGHEIFKKIISN